MYTKKIKPVFYNEKDRTFEEWNNMTWDEITKDIEVAQQPTEEKQKLLSGEFKK